MWVPAQLRGRGRGSAGGELLALLRGTAEVHRALLGAARDAGVDVPKEALLDSAILGDREVLRWDDWAAIDAEDWNFDDEGALPI